MSTAAPVPVLLSVYCLLVFPVFVIGRRRGLQSLWAAFVAKPQIMRNRCSIAVVVSAGVAIVAAPAIATSSASHSSRPGWSRPDLHPVTQPAPAGNRVIVLVAARGRLRLLGLDSRTGRTRWSQPASTGDNAPGQPPLFALVRDRIVYLRAVAKSISRLAAADPLTGRTVWSSKPGQFTAWPDLCPQSATTICVTRAFGQNQLGSVLRFDARTGHLLGTLSVSRNSYARAVGTGLYDPGDRAPEMLVASDEARVLWARPLRAIFNLPGASTDWGWNFSRLDRLALFIGSPGSAPTRRKNLYISDLSHTMTAAFRIADGAVAWRSAGAYQCEYLPCAGASYAGYAAPGNDEAPTVALRLLAKGTLSGPANAIPRVSATATATLQGFEPATGRTLWTFAAGHNPGLILGTSPPPRLSQETIAVRNNSGALESLNLRTGVRHGIAHSAAAWCSRFIQYRLTIGYPGVTSGVIHDHIGQYAAIPCTPAGRRTKRPTLVPQFVGAATSGLVVWSDTHGVFAARAAP
jgi:hypothetical protein